MNIKHSIRLIPALIACLLCAGSAQDSVQPAPRGPSTAAERERFVRIAKALEANPVAIDMAEDREWARVFIDQVPDIGVHVCSASTDYLSAPNYAYGPALRFLAILAGGRFAIENPANRDPNAQAVAMVEGTLRGYEALLKNDPGAANLRVETMIAKRDSDMLADYIRKACTPAVPK